jgi:hypothetical protein
VLDEWDTVVMVGRAAVLYMLWPPISWDMYEMHHLYFLPHSFDHPFICQAVVVEAFVKPGLANKEAPTNPVTGKKQHVFTACNVKVSGPTWETRLPHRS